MPRSKRSPRRTAVSSTSAAPETVRGPSSSPIAPSSRTRRVASAIIVAQFAILLLSLTANLSPSYLQGILTGVLAPYLVVTGQDYGAVPIELTHAESVDFPVLVEVHRATDPPETWRPLPLPGVALSNRRPLDWTHSRWCNLSRIVRLISDDFPESEILSEFAAQMVRWDAARDARETDAVRIVAPYIPSFDEFEYVADGDSSQVADAFDDQVLFTARILPASAGGFALVPQQDAVRTSKSRLPVGGNP